MISLLKAPLLQLFESDSLVLLISNTPTLNNEIIFFENVIVPIENSSGSISEIKSFALSTNPYMKS